MSDNTNITYINMAFAGLSALGGISGLAAVILLIRHRKKDNRDTRIKEFIIRYQNLYAGHGGRFLAPLIPSGINLLKDDNEIEDALNALKLIYAIHPLRDRNDRVKQTGYKKFFMHSVDRNVHELGMEKVDKLINELI